MKKSIKELKENILKKAHKEAEQLISRAKKAEKRIIENGKNEAKRIIEEVKTKEKNLSLKEKKRIKSEKKIVRNRELLAKREKLFLQLTLDLEEKLIHMLKEGELSTWIKSVYSEISNRENRKITLITRKKDTEYYKKVIKEMNIELKEEMIEPGFLLRADNYEYDFRFYILSEKIIKGNRKKIISLLGINNG